MTIDSAALLPIVQPVIIGAMRSVVPSLRRNQDIGLMPFGNNKARVQMNLSIGTPKRHRKNIKEYLQDIIIVESMKITIYMATNGTWNKRINTGMIIFADVYIDFPKCKFCGKRPNNNHYIIESGFLKRVKICKATGKKVTIMDENKMSRNTADSIN